MTKVDFTGYMHSNLNVEKARLFVSNFKHYEEIFDKDILATAVAKFKVRDFACHKEIQEEHVKYYEKYPYYSDIHYGNFKVYLYQKGIEYEGTERRRCYSFIVPDSYQLHEKELLAECIFNTMPELQKLNWSMYHLDDSSYSDVYLTTSSGSLYCPVKSLIAYDKDEIISRHTSYHKQYYHSAERKPYLDKALNVLTTTETSILFQILDSYKDKKQIVLNKQEKTLLENIEKTRAEQKRKEFVKYDLFNACERLIKKDFVFSYIKEEDKEYVVITTDDNSEKVEITNLSTPEITSKVIPYLYK